MPIVNKLPLVCILILLLSCSPNEQSDQASGDIEQIEGYQLVWHDEFNEGSKPDTSNWSYETGFVRNKELQWYQRDNATIKNGKLVIEGRRERLKNKNFDSTSTNWKEKRPYAQYTSASINTSNKKDFKYGIVKVRAKTDTAKGMWPAIWTLGTHQNRQWPANGEVDIMEFYRVDGEQTILANAAWAGKNNQDIWDDKRIPFDQFLKQDSKWPEKYHIWKMNWSKESIKLYLDDKLLNTVNLDKTRNPDGFNPLRQPHYILLNLALGSNGGDPSNTSFPKYYKVDYVRVYQKEND